jgi:hypothetical protein
MYKITAEKLVEKYGFGKILTNAAGLSFVITGEYEENKNFYKVEYMTTSLNTGSKLVKKTEEIEMENE